jgi:hypothetical protein
MENESGGDRYMMVRLALGQALGLFAYCLLVGLVLWNGEHVFGPMKHFMGPVLLLVLFVSSALISALIMLGYPVYLIWEKKRVVDGLCLIAYSSGWLVLFVIIGLSVFAFNSAKKEIPVVSEKTEAIYEMNIDEAILIAQDSDCTRKGDLASKSFYNENSKTWWIDLDMKKEFKKDACNPACVVSEELKTAEINWRCGGALQ